MGKRELIHELNELLQEFDDVQISFRIPKRLHGMFKETARSNKHTMKAILIPMIVDYILSHHKSKRKK